MKNNNQNTKGKKTRKWVFIGIGIAILLIVIGRLHGCMVSRLMAASGIKAEAEASPTLSPSPTPEPEPTPFTTDDNVMGNTSANLRAWGNAAVQGDWIYYSGNEDSLYRMSLDGTTVEKLTVNEANYINVMGEAVFFAGDVGRGVYRISAEGGNTDRLCANRVSMLAAAGAWLYFLDYEDDYIYRISQSGGDAEKIGSRAYESFFIHEANIYANYMDGNTPAVQRIALSDLSGTAFLRGDSVYCGDGGWLYGTDKDGDRFRVALDGSERENLGMTGYQDVPFEGRIYSHGGAARLNWSVDVGSIYVRKPEDKKGTLILSGNCYHLNLVPGWIFYLNYDEADEEIYAWRIPIRGGTPVKIP